MVKAYFKSTLIAETDHPVEVEGNQYFPTQDVKMEYLKPSDLHTVCPWKGTASYYHVAVNDEADPNAAWYYPEPSAAAAMIRGHIAFWKNVRVVKD
ncbi:MAG: hypothetical protein H6Q07_2492 [Acidobacteria bacterium]|nr:hypothetical protein [Acidobacteriota bacterium]